MSRRKSKRVGPRRHRWFWGLLAALLTGLATWFTPLPAAWQIATLTRPSALARLPKRGANPVLNQVVFWLADSRDRGFNPTNTLNLGLDWAGVSGPQRPLVEASLLRNLDIATRLGLTTPDNLDRLRKGRAATVTRGPYTGEAAEVDHIVPVSLAPEIGNELANLELMPATLNRRKSNRVGPRQAAHARILHQAGLLSQPSLDRVLAELRDPP
jgi:hypothetical protein